MLIVIDPDSGIHPSAEGLRSFGVLSEAELQVCELLVRGFTTKDVAERRGSSLETIRAQVKAASAKLACRSRLDMLRLALATAPPLEAHGVRLECARVGGTPPDGAE
jgi:DNA-binding NarL/FixJ family response regulator